MKNPEKQDGFRWSRMTKSCWAPDKNTPNKGVTGKLMAGGRGFFKNVLAADEIRENAHLIGDLAAKITPKNMVMERSYPHPGGGEVAFREACQKHGFTSATLQESAQNYLLGHRINYGLALQSSFLFFYCIYLLLAVRVDTTTACLMLFSLALAMYFSGNSIHACLRIHQIQHQKLCDFVEFFGKAGGWKRLFVPIIRG